MTDFREIIERERALAADAAGRFSEQEERDREATRRRDVRAVALAAAAFAFLASASWLDKWLGNDAERSGTVRPDTAAATTDQWRPK